MTVPATCPSCGAPASGRFCSSCGTALAGATCSSCAAPLTPGAHFCHRCGTPAGATSAPTRGAAAVLPWAVAAIALVSVIALVAGQRFGARQGAAEPASGSAVNATAGGPSGAMPRAPDISQMTPEQQAERLYDRIMREYEAGQLENVRTFMPMAVAAYERLSPLSLDQRYDLGRIGEVGGDLALTRAQAAGKYESGNFNGSYFTSPQLTQMPYPPQAAWILDRDIGCLEIHTLLAFQATTSFSLCGIFTARRLLQETEENSLARSDQIGSPPQVYSLRHHQKFPLSLPL